MLTLGNLIERIDECYDLRYLTIYQDRVSELYVKREIDSLDVDLLVREVFRYHIEILKLGCYTHLTVWLN